MIEYNVIGIMSGTSLDGVDIAFCSFSKEKTKWKFSIEHAETLDYAAVWRKRLSSLEKQNAFTFVKTHIEYGHYLGNLVKHFIKKSRGIGIDFVASHGHTIFHQPSKKITSQIGDGAAIAAECGLPVVCDFRTMDVALGGQGAPLVPIGDKYLFAEYDYCLNLGGIANISFTSPPPPLSRKIGTFNKERGEGERFAFDICPANMPLNYLAKSLKKEYDKNGNIAAQGKINHALLAELNELKYYKKKFPKSLGKEWVDEEFLPFLQKFNISAKDKLRTVCEHIAVQISLITNHQSPITTILITGGGAFNIFLVNLIKEKTKLKIIVPDEKIVKYKEALIFAFLGVLRMRNEINCLKSVTGAKKDNIGGTIYLGV